MSERTDWFESWFNSPYYEILYYDRDEKEAELFIDKLLAFLDPPADASFLDLACGSGRHSTYLASKGYEVTGIDLSKKHIREAIEFESNNLSFYVHDMRNEFRINYFDYTFNFFTSFGYFESEHDNLRTLENVCKGLKKNGIFVLDFFNVNKVTSNLVKEEHKKIAGVEFKINRSIENGFIVKDIDLIDKGMSLHFEEKVQALSLNEFRRYFDKICLSIKHTFGNYALDPYEEDSSDRLIIIAEKTL